MLKKDFQNQLNQAIKEGDTLKSSVLRSVLNTIQNKEFEKRTKLSKTITDIEKLKSQSELNEEEIQEAVLAEAKKRKESIEQFKSGGRDELAKKERDELGVLSEYLPQQMDEESIVSFVKQTIEKLGAQGAKDIGRVMAEVMKELKGKADGSIVSNIVKRELNA